MAGILVATACRSAALAQPVAAPAPTMIFFDWGKSELQREYGTILDEAAADYLRGAGGIIEVVGHSDRSGPAARNRSASRARAQVVRDYLVARGVPVSAIAVRASGEDQLIVPTPDGVREPQNRRVDVRFVRPSIVR
jgi:outer membrane protein OmpA-like peptidoglycan-associated protein